MKKSCLIVVIATLAAIAGALAAVAVYLRRREKELDEYEQLLFSEDFKDEDDYDEDEEAAEPQEEAEEVVEAPIADAPADEE